GGLRSQLDFWRSSPSNPSAPPPWMNPMVDLAGRFTVIGMDQRNAGKSRGAVTETHGWHTYASDHLALMDHLGHRRFHVMGGCIGGTFCLTLCEMAPERVAAAVLQNPIGLHENRDTWDEAVSGFAKTMIGRDPSVTEEVIKKFGHNMFGGDFVFSVSREFVRRCRTPLLLQGIRNQCVNDGSVASGQEVRTSDVLRAYLEGSGLDIEVYEPDGAPGRTSLVARIEGTDPAAPTLCLMGHTDVVPVTPSHWTRDPFGGELVNGEVWGRGAIDMLNLPASQAAA